VRSCIGIRLIRRILGEGWEEEVLIRCYRLGGFAITGMISHKMSAFTD